MLYTVLATLFLPLISHFSSRPEPAPPKDDKILNFQLRHYHAVSADARVAFSDALPSAQLLDAPYSIRTRNISTFRPPSFQEFSRVRSLSRHGAAESLHWDKEEIPAPDVERRQTLLLLAKMTNNAYVEPDSVEWYKLDGNWTVAYPFGWEPDADGFKGHVFATPDNGTVVLSIKGTSGGIWNGGGPTAKKDKLNDNLLFSCCCARVGWSWTPVCGCWRGDRKCHQDCLEDALMEESLFYPIGTNLYNNLTYMYPDSNIWVIGHSMGGSVASLLGVTFGPPVVAFEAPGEKLAATRLHLPSPPSTQHVIHVYNTADPIAMGTCNGVLSTCSVAGYAMETSCHLGKTIVYDTVSTWGWSVNIGNHGIVTVINDMLGKPWPPSEQEGKEVPEAKYEKDCMDCYSWEYGDFL